MDIHALFQLSLNSYEMVSFSNSLLVTNIERTPSNKEKESPFISIELLFMIRVIKVRMCLDFRKEEKGVY